MPVSLFTSEDLLAGFELNDPTSFVKTWDFAQYMYFVGAGGPSPSRKADTLNEAKRDADISYALRTYIHDKNGPLLVGIMGGHSIVRTEPSYRLIATLSRRLTQGGFLIVTGGGPGAMEAGHLGAAFANSKDDSFEQALLDLATQPALDPTKLVDQTTGRLIPGQDVLIRKSHDWMAAALLAKSRADGPLGESLAIPTWLYGQEPTTPFATAYAKFFQNSLREETLIANGRVGMLYAREGGGTLREIFQDVEVNYYVKNAEDFIPMLFVDPSGYWKTEATYDQSGAVKSAGIKVDKVLHHAFRFALGQALYDECSTKIRFTTDFDEIKSVLEANSANSVANLTQMLAGNMTKLMSLRRS